MSKIINLVARNKATTNLKPNSMNLHYSQIRRFTLGSEFLNNAGWMMSRQGQDMYSIGKWPKTFPKSREGRNIHGKHIMTKQSYLRMVLQVALLDKYVVPTGLRNVFLGLFCYSCFVPNGTEPGLLQVLDDAPRLRAFLKK